jgi:phosphoribulokinase
MARLLPEQCPTTSQRPILLGIIGDSAAGKTTIAAGLAKILGAERVTHICTDDYHKHDRKERATRGITPLDPNCNHIDVLEQHLQRLHYGQAILKPVYEHSTGTLIRPEYVTPRPFVIVEGLLGFCTPALRQLYDVKVYLSPPEEMRKLWKLNRDTTKRGYTAEQVLAELEQREPDSRKFIRPQRVQADIVVEFYPPLGSLPEQPGLNLNVRLVLRPTIPHPDLSYLAKAQNSTGTGVRLRLGRDEGRPADFLEIDGDVAAQHAEEVEDTIYQHISDLRPVSDNQFDASRDRLKVGHSPPLLLTQLLIAYHLLRKVSDPTPSAFQLYLPERPLPGGRAAGPRY